MSSKPVFIFALLACTHWFVPLIFSLLILIPSHYRPFYAPPELQVYLPHKEKSLNAYKNSVISANSLFVNLSRFMEERNLWSNTVMVLFSSFLF